MPAGKHREGYQRPRTGEKRRTRQPLKMDRLPAEVRDAIQKARAEGKIWEEIAEIASKVAGTPLSDEVCRRWYDLRVEQVLRETVEMDELAEKNLRRYFGRTLAELPEAAAHSLKAEVYGMQSAKTSTQREASIGNFLSVLSKIIEAQSKQKRAEIEERKVNLAQKKFEELKSKAEKATDEAAAKIGKGKELTIEDVNRIRRKVFGLGPATA